MEKDFRKRHQSLGEEIGNAITHGMGALLSIFFAIIMFLKCDNFIHCFSVTIFSLSMFFLYLSSCLYHAFKNGSKVKRVFKRFDHLSIYLLIAGTFAPILLIEIGGTVGWVFFSIQWFLTIFGILSKILFPNRFQLLHIALFLIIGWSGLFFFPYLIKNNIGLLWFILSGGIMYTIGVLFYCKIIFKYHHFIWHFFVLFGTILQVIGIYFFVL